jgi:hypothetical protein
LTIQAPGFGQGRQPGAGDRPRHGHPDAEQERQAKREHGAFRIQIARKQHDLNHDGATQAPASSAGDSPHPECQAQSSLYPTHLLQPNPANRGEVDRQHVEHR